MEYKPLKRSKYIISLSHDHHLGLLFCWKIKQGLAMNIDPSRVRNFVIFFWENNLKPHFIAEEEILFQKIADEKVRKAIDQHAAIRQIAEKITKEGDSEIPEHLLALAGLTDEHIRYEERILFPWFETFYSEDQLVAIASQLEKRTGCSNKFEDQFWIKNFIPK